MKTFRPGLAPVFTADEISTPTAPRKSAPPLSIEAAKAAADLRHSAVAQSGAAPATQGPNVIPNPTPSPPLKEASSVQAEADRIRAALIAGAQQEAAKEAAAKQTEQPKS